MKRLRLLPLLLTAAMLFGCAAGPETDGAARIAAPKAAAVRGMKKDGRSVGEREKLSEGYRDALKAFCTRAAREGLVREETENEIISPVSLFFATAALAGTAEGKTRDELLQVLGMEEAMIEAETEKLLHNMNIDDSMGRLQAAGSLWLADAFAAAIDAEAAKAFADRYGMELWRVDFAAASAAKQLAAWVREHTNGNLGDAEAFQTDPQTALMLLNTVYYKDEWLDRFNAEKTEADTFHNADDSETECDFLNATYGIGPDKEKAWYYDDNNNIIFKKDTELPEDQIRGQQQLPFAPAILGAGVEDFLGNPAKNEINAQMKQYAGKFEDGTWERWPSCYMTVEEKEDIATTETDLQVYSKNQLAKWIAGESDVNADWDNYLKELENVGLSHYLEVKQQIFDRYDSAE